MPRPGKEDKGWPQRIIERLKERAPALQAHKQAYEQMLGAVRGAMSNLRAIQEEQRRHIEVLNDIYAQMGTGLGHLKETEYDPTYNALMHDITFIINLEIISSYDPAVLAQVAEWAETDVVQKAVKKISPQKRAILLAALEEMKEEP